MATVYVVEAGEYSGKYVVGVYSTREKADLVAHAHDGYVSEYAVDADADRFADGLVAWRVSFHNGILREVARIDEIDRGEDGRISESSSPNYGRPYYDERGNQQYHPYDILWLTVFARDEGHALKIAQDKRAAYLATKAGVT